MNAKLPAIPPTGPRLILLASAQSYRSSPFVAAAKTLGITVVFGQDLPLPMHNNSLAQLPLDYRDLPGSVSKIQAYAQQHPVGAILALDDSATLLAARASASLGLSHNNAELAAATRDKYLMRQQFALHGVPSPHFEIHSIHEDLSTLANKLPYPCVLKPTNMSGSRGVMRANNPSEFIRYAQRLKPLLLEDRCEQFLVEAYIPGVEVALEGLLDNGQLKVLALFDKPDPLEGPFFEETIYVTPSRLPEASQEAIAHAAAQAAHALGLVQGPIHAELRVNEQGPWLLEIAPRSIGGLCSQSLRFGTQTSLEELILRQAFQLPNEELQRSNPADGVMMIAIPEAGLLKSVSGIEAAKQVPGITEIEITAPFNTPLVPLPEGNSYLGFIFATGDTPDKVENALRTAHRLLEFNILPQLNIL